EKLAQNWFSANHLNLNSNKTQQLLISKRLEQGVQAGVSLLGVRMDNMLNWSQHIHHLCEKLSGLTFLFRNLRNSLNCEYTIKAYYAIVQSALTYGITLWGNAPNAIKVFKWQKKIIRVIVGVRYRDHCRPLFTRLRIMTLPCLFIYFTVLEIHKNLSKYKKQSEIHEHNTRFKSNLSLPKLRLTSSKNNLLDVRLYNALDAKFKSMTMNSFKHQ